MWLRMPEKRGVRDYELQRQKRNAAGAEDVKVAAKSKCRDLSTTSSLRDDFGRDDS
jgi:hypothetical protein